MRFPGKVGVTTPDRVCANDGPYSGIAVVHTWNEAQPLVHAYDFLQVFAVRIPCKKTSRTNTITIAEACSKSPLTYIIKI